MSGRVVRQKCPYPEGVSVVLEVYKPVSDRRNDDVLDWIERDEMDDL